MKKLAILGLVGLFGWVLAASACADPITGREDKPWSYTYTFRADVNEVEPNDSCPTANAINCGDVVHAQISPAAENDYFIFTVPASTSIAFGTDADGASPIGDSYIYLYDANCAQLAYDDDSGPGLYSLITYTSAAGGTYIGRVKAYSATRTGTYKAFVTCTTIVVPENDLCERAIMIPPGVINLAGTTQFATNDYDPGVPGPSCTGFSAAGRDVAYVFTVCAGSTISLSYTNVADASFYIVTDCGEESTSCLVGVDATVSGQAEVLDYTFATTGTYYLILDSYGTNTGGAWTLTGNLDTGPSETNNATWGKVKRTYK